MKIQVEIFGSRKAYLSRVKKGLLLDVEFEKGTKVSDLLDRFHVVSKSRSKTRVNRMVVPQGYILRENDKVTIFSPILAGGG